MTMESRHLEDAARRGMGSLSSDDFKAERSNGWLTGHYTRIVLFASTVVMSGALGYGTF